MGKSVYVRFKRPRSTFPARRQLPQPIDAAKRAAIVAPVRHGPSEQTVQDYSTFKETITSAVGEIKLQIDKQHEQTRAEVRLVRREVLDTVNASPAALVKLICEFVFLFLLFSLALRLILKIDLVNPVFALFALPALAVYWGMAHLKQKTEKRDQT